MKLITKLILSAILLIGSLSFAEYVTFINSDYTESIVTKTCRQLEGEKLETFRAIPREQISEYRQYLNDKKVLISSEVKESGELAISILFPLFKDRVYNIVVKMLGLLAFPHPNLDPSVDKRFADVPAIIHLSKRILIEYAEFCHQ